MTDTQIHIKQQCSMGCDKNNQSFIKTNRAWFILIGTYDFGIRVSINDKVNHLPPYCAECGHIATYVCEVKEVDGNHA